MPKKKEKSKISLKSDGRWLIGNMPFLMFLVGMLLVYIANVHYAEKKMREIKNLQSELVEVQYKYKSLKAEMNKKRRYGYVMDEAGKLGLVEGGKAVKVIEMED